MFVIFFQNTLTQILSTDADIPNLAVQVLIEYAGDDVPDNPIALKKAYMAFEGDLFLLGFDEVLNRLSGKHCFSIIYVMFCKQSSPYTLIM